MKEFDLEGDEWLFPIAVRKVYHNQYNTKLYEGVIDRTDDFPILGSGKSRCHESDKPISKMFSDEVL
jgi:hypothetical protein